MDTGATASAPAEALPADIERPALIGVVVVVTIVVNIIHCY